MYTSIDLNNVDFIGWLENLLSGFRYVVDNIDTNNCAKASHLNTRGKYNYRKFFTSYLEQQVADRYQKDLQLFSNGFDRLSNSDNIHDRQRRDL